MKIDADKLKELDTVESLSFDEALHRVLVTDLASVAKVPVEIAERAVFGLAPSGDTSYIPWIAKQITEFYTAPEARNRAICPDNEDPVYFEFVQDTLVAHRHLLAEGLVPPVDAYSSFYDLCESLELFPEALQQSQIDRVVKDYRAAFSKNFREAFPSTASWAYDGIPGPSGIGPNHITATLAEYDPTSGKYAGWLLSRWHDFIKGLKTREWYLKQDDELKQKVLDGEASPDEVRPKRRELRNKAFSATWPVNSGNLRGRNITDTKEAVRKALYVHSELLRLGRAEENEIHRDIFEYKTIDKLIEAIRGVPEEALIPDEKVKSKEADPWKVLGSEIVYNDGENIIYEIDKPRSAMFHARGTTWCFRYDNYATQYTARGPIYVVYTRSPRVAEIIGNPVEATNWDNWYKIIGLTFDFRGVGAKVLEIRDTKNVWLPAEKVKEAGLLDAISSLRTAYVDGGSEDTQQEAQENNRVERDRGFELWLKGENPQSPENIQNIPDRDFNTRATIKKYVPGEDIEAPKGSSLPGRVSWYHPASPYLDEHYAPPEIERLIREYGGTVSFEGEDRVVRVDFSSNEPRHIANYRWFVSEYDFLEHPDNPFVGAPIWFEFTLQDAQEAGVYEDLVDQIEAHIGWEQFDDSAEHEIEEEMAKDQWKSYLVDDFYREIVAFLESFAEVESGFHPDDSDNATLLGVRWEHWEKALEKYLEGEDEILWNLYSEWVYDVSMHGPELYWEYQGNGDFSFAEVYDVIGHHYKAIPKVSWSGEAGRNVTVEPEEPFDHDEVVEMAHFLRLPTSPEQARLKRDIEQGQQFIPGIDPEELGTGYRQPPAYDHEIAEPEDEEDEDEEIVEAVQQSQLDRFVKDYRDAFEDVERMDGKWPSAKSLAYPPEVDSPADITPELVLGIVNTYDPTVTPPIEELVTGSVPPLPAKDPHTLQGKYSGWLLRLWHQFVKALKQRKYFLQQWDELEAKVKAGNADPDAASGPMVSYRMKAHEIVYVNWMKNLYPNGDTYTFHNNADATRQYLEAHRVLVQVGNAKKNEVESDIYRYPTINALVSALSTVPAGEYLPGDKGVIQQGDLDPTQIPGSKIVYTGDDTVIYEIDKPMSAMYHGADTDWCFETADYAKAYTERGPIYVVYSKNPSVLRGIAPDYPESDSVRKAQNMEGWYKVAAFTFDSMAISEEMHTFEIQDASNEWIMEDRATVAGIFGAIESLREGRDRGFLAWAKGHDIRKFANEGAILDLSPLDRVTVREYDPDDDLPEIEIDFPGFNWQRPQAPPFYDGADSGSFLQMVDDLGLVYDEETESIIINFDSFDPAMSTSAHYLAGHYSGVTIERWDILKIHVPTIDAMTEVGIGEFENNLRNFLDYEILDDEAYSDALKEWEIEAFSNGGAEDFYKAIYEWLVANRDSQNDTGKILGVPWATWRKALEDKPIHEYGPLYYEYLEELGEEPEWLGTDEGFDFHFDHTVEQTLSNPRDLYEFGKFLGLTGMEDIPLPQGPFDGPFTGDPGSILDDDEDLEEALQQSQVDKFVKTWNKISELEKQSREITRDWGLKTLRDSSPPYDSWAKSDVVMRVNQADPTFPENQNYYSGSGKYGSWLLSQWSHWLKALQTINWSELELIKLVIPVSDQNYHQMDDVGTYLLVLDSGFWKPFELIDIEPDEADRYDMLMIAEVGNPDNEMYVEKKDSTIGGIFAPQDRDKVRDIVERKGDAERVHEVGLHLDLPSDRNRIKDLLDRHNKLVETGRAEAYKVPTDIFQIKEWWELEAMLSKIPRTAYLSGGDIGRGDIDPELVPGSRGVYNENGTAVFECNIVEAAMYHGADTNWCFEGEDYAEQYIQNGPVYVLYSKHPVVLDVFSRTDMTPASNMEGWFKVLAFSWDSGDNQHIWEIKDADNKDPGHALVREAGLIPVLEGLRAGRDRGFSFWSRGAAVKVGQIADRYPSERITVSDDWAEDEIPIDPNAIPEELRELFDRHDLDWDGDIDSSVDVRFDREDLREYANYLYFRNTYYLEDRSGGNFYLDFPVADLAELDSLYRDLSKHLEDDAHLNQEYEDERIEEIARESFGYTGAEEFYDSLHETLDSLANQSYSQNFTEEPGFLIGIPWEDWEERLELFKDDIHWLEYKYFEWADYVNKSWTWEGSYVDYNTDDVVEDYLVTRAYEKYVYRDEEGNALMTPYKEMVYPTEPFDKERMKRLADALDLQTPTRRKREAELEQGQQFIPGVSPEGFEDSQKDTRSVIREMLGG